MKKVIEAKGNTIEEAIESALLLLGCDRDDVSVEVLEQPKSGFLGFGRQKALVKVEYETTPTAKAKEFAEGILYRFGTPCSVKVSEDLDKKVINMELAGDNMNVVIGRRGETLDAIQYLTTIVANREEDEHWRVVIDAENYRSRREDSLESLAKKMAEKAIKYKKPVALDSMPANERRVIHSILQEMPGVSTHSTGSEPNRKVVIVPDGVSASAPAQSGSKKSGHNGNYRRRRNHRGGQGKKPSQNAPKAE